MHRRWLILVICLGMMGFSMNRAHAMAGNEYRVKKGDTLWSISRTYHVGIEQLKEINGLKKDHLVPGETLQLPTQNSNGNKITGKNGLNLTNNDFNWLVRITEAEAGGESFDGKVAVASVVLNRVLHKDYPDTVTHVIFEKKGKMFQFSPVGDGRIYHVVPSEESYKAVRTALQGIDPTSGALFFYNPKTARGSWIRSREVIAEIGKHQFAY
ncbi:MAG TPA: cell wall hydrolase [Bacillota bacterium]|nr:cell wall hydrolase [Bacillota bacterium]